MDFTKEYAKGTEKCPKCKKLMKDCKCEKETKKEHKKEHGKEE